MMQLDSIYQSREYKTLDDIFNDDPTGLLNDVTSTPKQEQSSGVLAQQFDRVNQFIDMYGHLPRTDGDTNEKILARLLSTIQTQHISDQALHDRDKHGLLGAPNANATQVNQDSASSALSPIATDIEHKTQTVTNFSNAKVFSNTKASADDQSDTINDSNTIQSLDDIFASDDLGLFDSITADILVSDTQDNTRARYDQFDDEDIAKRFECPDFYQFEATFDRITHAVQTGAFNKTSFSSVKDINIGSVFVLNGMLCYVADIYQAEARKNERNQHRLRLIFANGTESNMLIRSLATAQYKYENSYQLLITDPDWINDALSKNFGDHRKLTGVIYVAKLTDIPSNLVHYQHLHKIGFSTLTGEARTKHSLRDTAFLQQPVDIIAEWQVYDANARSVENILHAFFYDQRVKVSLKAGDHQRYNATEWFDVPIDEIEKAINLVVAGEIKHYRMDGVAGKVVLR